MKVLGRLLLHVGQSSHFLWSISICLSTKYATHSLVTAACLLDEKILVCWSTWNLIHVYTLFRTTSNDHVCDMSSRDRRRLSFLLFWSNCHTSRKTCVLLISKHVQSIHGCLFRGSLLLHVIATFMKFYLDCSTSTRWPPRIIAGQLRAKPSC